MNLPAPLTLTVACVFSVTVCFCLLCVWVCFLSLFLLIFANYFKIFILAKTFLFAEEKHKMACEK